MKKINFFVIDDSEINNMYTEDVLEEIDFVDQIDVFEDATKALEILIERINNKEALPDVILLDIRMPEMDGYEFLDELDQEIDDETFNTKIFILTSSNHRKDLESFGKQNLAAEFLNKPLEKDQLLEKLSLHLG